MQEIVDGEPRFRKINLWKVWEGQILGGGQILGSGGQILGGCEGRASNHMERVEIR